ncbi:MAG: acyl-CoA dehydrogenase family protein [Dehalococcoidales bacterium]|nr:MAG: acyl-CoA dehydrogenase family protein [Dehalococcoidales bacterium]
MFTITRRELNMTSTDIEKAEALRKEVRAWLDENLPEKWGTPEYVAPERLSPEAQELGTSFQKRLYDAGYTGFNVAKEYGGVERPAWETAIIREELARRGTPPGPTSIGPLMVIGTLLAWGSEEQKKRFIPKILSGEEAWCEGFSEPNAGSDLANVQTTAVRDGDEWVVNGQKCWTSAWRFAHWSLLVTKTDPNAPRHRNLSYFIFPTDTPGFSRGPLKQMSGESEFGEMFFDDMRIPHENMIGEEGRGWYVAMSTLQSERGGGVGGGAGMMGLGIRSLGGVNNLIELARNTKRYGKSFWDDKNFRHRIVQFAIENEATRNSGTRMAIAMRKRTATGNEVSIRKNSQAERRKAQGDMVMEIIGAYSQLMRGDPRAVDNGTQVYNMLRARGATIEMGTSEINRNIIAERILGLPRD